MMVVDVLNGKRAIDLKRPHRYLVAHLKIIIASEPLMFTLRITSDRFHRDSMFPVLCGGGSYSGCSQTKHFADMDLIVSHT